MNNDKNKSNPMDQQSPDRGRNPQEQQRQQQSRDPAKKQDQGGQPKLDPQGESQKGSKQQ